MALITLVSSTIISSALIRNFLRRTIYYVIVQQSFKLIFYIFKIGFQGCFHFCKKMLPGIVKHFKSEPFEYDYN